MHDEQGTHSPYSQAAFNRERRPPHDHPRRPASEPAIALTPASHLQSRLVRHSCELAVPASSPARRPQSRVAQEEVGRRFALIFIQAAAQAAPNSGIPTVRERCFSRTRITDHDHPGQQSSPVHLRTVVICQHCFGAAKCAIAPAVFIIQLGILGLAC